MRANVLLPILGAAGVAAALTFLVGRQTPGPERPEPPALTAAGQTAHGGAVTATAPTPAPVSTPATLKAPLIDRSALENQSAADQALIRKLQALFVTGDFLATARKAKELAARKDLSPGFQSWLATQMPAILISAGWSRLNLGDCPEALRWFAEADAVKRQPESIKGQAVCHFKEKNIYAARESFAAYLEQSPSDPEMLVLYADVLESEGRFEDAIRSLERAEQAMTAAKPGDPAVATGVRQRLAAMRGKASESRQQLTESSRNFRLVYRAGDHEDLVAYVLETLEDTLDELIEGYGFRPPATPIEAGLYPHNAFGSVIPGGPAWAEGLFDGRMRIPLRDDQVADPRRGSLASVLRHELVHALFARMTDSRSLPPWFDEGMAQRLSCPRDGCGPFRFPSTPGGLLSVESFQKPYISLPALEAGRSYSQSLYLVRLLETRHGDDVLRRVVSGLDTATDITSDGLLRPLGLAFATLHAEAAAAWARQAQP